MASLNDARNAVAEQLKRRAIRRIVYFHCDHFEPWRSFDGRAKIDGAHAEDLVTFAEDLSRIDYARKLTLFYCPHIEYAFDRSRDLRRAAPDDLLGLLKRKPAEVEVMRTGMKQLIQTVPHEIQVHIHHEGMTTNTSHSLAHVVEYFATERGRELDSDRLGLIICAVKEAIRAETDLDLQRWFFVHGHWALQASDADSCCITDELSVLMRYGCLGDFTFPAGRRHVNPVLEVPYFCKPINAVRGYDRAECEPELAYGNRDAASRKFLIWSSAIKHNRSSIDYYAPWVREALERPEKWALDVAALSYAVDGTLYFKTHSHSMYHYYREGKRRPVYPHQHPGMQTVFGLVFDGAVAANAEVEFLTVGEVYDRFVSAVWKPATAATLSLPATVKANVLQPLLPPAPYSVIERKAPMAGLGPRPSHRPRAAALIGLPALTLDSAVELVDTVAIPALRASSPQTGPALMRMIGHCSRRSGADTLFGARERALLPVLQELAYPAGLHTLGPGAALVAIAIGLCRRKTVGIEGSESGHLAACTIYDAVAEARPDLLLCCELAPGLTQQHLVRCPALVTLTDHWEAELQAALTVYSTLLLELPPISADGHATAQHSQRAEMLVSRHLPHSREVLTMPDNGRVILFKKD